MYVITLALALALLAPQPMPIPQPMDPIAAIQYAHRGPADAIVLGPGDSAVVPLEKGVHGGLEVMRSNGVVTPRCPVVVASAHVVADGPVTSAIDVGVRLGNWTAVMEGGAIVPMTAIPLLPGQSVRLRVGNPGRGPVTVSIFGTRLSVYAANCAPVEGAGLLAR